MKNSSESPPLDGANCADRTQVEAANEAGESNSGLVFAVHFKGASELWAQMIVPFVTNEFHGAHRKKPRKKTERAGQHPLETGKEENKL
jgi:hypothetical protein